MTDRDAGKRPLTDALPRTVEGKLKAVAMVNFVLAGLTLFRGGFLVAASLFLTVLDAQFQFLSRVSGNQSAETPFSSGVQLAMLSAVVQLVMVIPMIVSGAGLLRNRLWGVQLAVLLAVGSGLYSLFCLAALRYGDFVWFGGYSIFVLWCCWHSPWRFTSRLPRPSNPRHPQIDA